MPIHYVPHIRIRVPRLIFYYRRSSDLEKVPDCLLFWVAVKEQQPRLRMEVAPQVSDRKSFKHFSALTWQLIPGPPECPKDWPIILKESDIWAMQGPLFGAYLESQVQDLFEKTGLLRDPAPEASQIGRCLLLCSQLWWSFVDNTGDDENPAWPYVPAA